MVAMRSAVTFAGLVFPGSPAMSTATSPASLNLEVEQAPEDEPEPPDEAVDGVYAGEDEDELEHGVVLLRVSAGVVDPFDDADEAVEDDDDCCDDEEHGSAFLHEQLSASTYLTLTVPASGMVALPDSSSFQSGEGLVQEARAAMA